jgi:uncharacterized GH25 family protein
MELRRFRLGIALFLVILAVGIARAQVSGQIRGTVIDEEGKGLAGVKVEASEPSAGKRGGVSDKEGRFRFVALRPGVYKVTFTMDSHADVEKNATVRLDGTATVNAKMFRIPG